MLSFEWMLMVTLLVIGLIGGLAGVRNAVLDQLYDLEQAIEAMNFSGSSNNNQTVSNNAVTNNAAAANNAVANNAAAINAVSNNAAAAAAAARNQANDANAWWGSQYQ